MTLTVKIDPKGRKAKSIINMLKELARDYPFLKIYEDDTELSDDMVKELEARYKHAYNNIEEGKDWEEIKAKLSD